MNRHSICTFHNSFCFQKTKMHVTSCHNVNFVFTLSECKYKIYIVTTYPIVNLYLHQSSKFQIYSMTCKTIDIGWNIADMAWNTIQPINQSINQSIIVIQLHSSKLHIHCFQVDGSCYLFSFKMVYLHRLHDEWSYE